jgi:hypothetical protein
LFCASVQLPLLAVGAAIFFNLIPSKLITVKKLTPQH